MEIKGHLIKRKVTPQLLHSEEEWNLSPINGVRVKAVFYESTEGDDSTLKLTKEEIPLLVYIWGNRLNLRFEDCMISLPLEKIKKLFGEKTCLRK